MKKTASTLSGLALCTTLSACYVAPMQPYATEPEYRRIVVAPAVSMPAPRPTLTVNLYPANKQAAIIGQVRGTIATTEHGHGEFSLGVAGEIFNGEATRIPNSNRGTANAAGSRGGYVKCEYTMNSATLGAGSCNFSNGARFDFHVAM